MHHKGDAANPNVRSRYIAKDIAYWKDDAMLAATPPLEGLRILLSDFATGGRACVRGRRSGAREALVVDFGKAHLRAFVNEDVYGALPPEVAEP
eukprot:3499087-Alexandrium_andersonii.AAC.1